MEHAPTASKSFRVGSDLAPHTAEVLAAEARAALKEGKTAFRFAVDPGFQPTMGWLDRLVAVIAPLVREKQPVEITCSPAQVDSLRGAGIHLIADMVVSAP